MQRIDSLRRSLRDSFRRSKKEAVESSKPHQWLADEEAVRTGNCYFSVKYLGCVEVYESRGMQVCEEAMKILRENLNPGARRRPVKAIIYVSGDGLRVVEDETKGLVVDQTIEKVSFCAPDRNHEKGFSYICRDGTTRRWMLYGFLASKDSGERLSHAVGCAFASCLERKQRREKEIGVQLTFDAKTSSFNRSSSMRSNSITDSNFKPPVPPPPSRNGNNSNNSITTTATSTTTPATSISNSFSNNFSNNENKSQNQQQQQPTSQINNNQNGNNTSTTSTAIDRPKAPLQMLERQGSFRGFQQLANRSPFKRQLSLRLSELPSTQQRVEHSAIDILTSHNITLSPPSQPEDTTSMSGSNDTLPSLISSGFNNIFSNNNINSNPNPVPPMRLQMRSRLHSLPTNSLSGISEGTAGDSNGGGKIENKDLVSELCQQVTLGLSRLAADHEEFKANNDPSQFPTNSTGSKNPWDQVGDSSSGKKNLPVLNTVNSVTTMGNNRISTIPAASDKTSPPSQVNSGRGGGVGGSWNERTSPTKTIISNSYSETKFSPVKSIPGIYTDHRPNASTSAASPTTSSSASTTVTKSNIDRDITTTTDNKPARPPLVSSKSLTGPSLQQRPIYKGSLQSSHKRSQSFDQPKGDPFDAGWVDQEKPLNPFKQTFQFAI